MFLPKLFDNNEASPFSNENQHAITTYIQRRIGYSSSSLKRRKELCTYTNVLSTNTNIYRKYHLILKYLIYDILKNIDSILMIWYTCLDTINLGWHWSWFRYFKSWLYNPQIGSVYSIAGQMKGTNYIFRTQDIYALLLL